MAQLVTAYRGILIEGRAPDWGALLVSSLFAGGLLYIGLVIFKRTSHMSFD
jgi:ABC-type polysaccharide/polyol phosphate export permease